MGENAWSKQAHRVRDSSAQIDSAIQRARQFEAADRRVVAARYDAKEDLVSLRFADGIADLNSPKAIAGPRTRQLITVIENRDPGKRYRSSLAGARRRSLRSRLAGTRLWDKAMDERNWPQRWIGYKSGQDQSRATKRSKRRTAAIERDSTQPIVRRCRVATLTFSDCAFRFLQTAPGKTGIAAMRRLRVRMRGRSENLRGGTGFDDTPALHHRNARGQLRDAPAGCAR